MSQRVQLRLLAFVLAFSLNSTHSKESIVDQNSIGISSIGEDNTNKSISVSKPIAENGTISQKEEQSIRREDVASFLKVLNYLTKLRQKELKNINNHQKTTTYSTLKTKNDGPTLLIQDVGDKMKVSTLNSLLYEDSEWSKCTRSCKTKRKRKCRIQNLCSLDILLESEFCYYPNTRCERKAMNILNKSTGSANVDIPTDSLPPYHDYQHGVHEPHYPEPQYANHDYTGHEYHEDWPTFELDDFIVPDLIYDSPPNQPDFEYYEDNTYENPSLYPNYAEPVGNDGSVEVDLSSVTGKPDQCGTAAAPVPSKMFRIIGGMEAIRHAWPWQVAVLNRYKENFCGGTIISPFWVLTAAHCVRKKLYVKIAEHDFRFPDGEVELLVERSIKHDDYNVHSTDNDIALLKLKSDIPAVRNVLKACLPPIGSSLPKGTKCVVLGWGKERESHIFGSDVLMYAKVPTVRRKTCASAYSEYEISKNMICAGYMRGGPDACEGDSGGPLLCQDDQNRWVIHGVTSFGDGCGERGKVGVYMKVANYINWINKTIENNL